MRRPAHLKKYALRIGFAGWAAALFVIGGTLMVSHWYTLPRPDLDDGGVAQALNQTRVPAQQGRWMAVHVLYTDCGCSQRIFEHLFASRRPTGVVEKVLLVGDHADYEERARGAGYDVHVLTPQRLRDEFRIEAAPMLAVLDPAGEVRYMGGYTERKRGPDIRDVAIITELAGDAASAPAVAELPLYGCGVSQELQTLLDPIGIKY